MKHWPLVIGLAALVALIWGCGGGGGGGGGGGEPTYNPIRVVAVSGANYVDLGNLKPGSTCQLRLIGYKSDNSATVLDTSGWVTNAPASVATVSAAGLVQAGAASATTYTVSTQYATKSYSATIAVKSNLAAVSGRVRNSAGTGIAGVVIEFYNGTGQIVGSVRSNAAGAFLGLVPTTAKSFSANLIDLLGYLDQYAYGAGEYSRAVAGCRTNLPPVVANGTVTLPHAIVLRRKVSGPPPPPPSCFND